MELKLKVMSALAFLAVSILILLMSREKNEVRKTSKVGSKNIVENFRVDWVELNQSEINTHFTKEELASISLNKHNLGICDDKQIAQQCCLGSKQGQYFQVKSDYCFADTNIIPGVHLFRQQYPIPYYKYPTLPNVDILYDMGDVLEVARNMRIVFYGDSVMGQNFDNMLCDIQRSTNHSIERIYKLNDPKMPREPNILMRSSVFIKESNTTFVFNKGTHFDERPFKESCKNADILIVNIGLHWRNMTEYRDDLIYLGKLLKIYCQGVRIVFRGTTLQHFMTKDGNFNPPDYVDKELLKTKYPKLYRDFAKRKKKSVNTGCLELEALPHPSRDDIAYEALKESGWNVYDALDMNNSGWSTLRKSMEILLFIPYGEISIAFHEFQSIECTHMCNTPYLWSIMFHFLYKILGEDFNKIKSTLYTPLPWKTNLDIETKKFGK